MAGVPGVFLKNSCLDLLANELTLSGLQHCKSSSKGAMDRWRRITLFGFRAKAGGETSSQTKVLKEAIVPFLSLPYSQHADTDRCHN